MKVTPVMLSVDLPVSLKISFSVSPFKRLMPLNDESCAVVLICWRTLLYCAIRLARVACEFGSTTGALAAAPLKASRPVAVPPTVADRRRSGVVRGHDGDLAGGVDAGLQIVRSQRGVELVEGRDLAGAGAEGDAGGGAAAGGADRQRLAAERRRGNLRRAGGQTEGRQRAGIAADHQRRRGAGAQGQLGGAKRRGNRCTR